MGGIKSKVFKKRIFITSVSVFALITLIIFCLFLIKDNALLTFPILKIETPQKRVYGDKEPFTVDITLSSLGNELYPAVSFSIDFDKSRLEFIGIEEGNILISDAQNGQKLPEWNVNVEQSNKTGTINIMYLDMTGGKYAFSNDLLAKEDNVVLRLSFCLRGSARRGDVYELNISDAVFASNDEENSLASSKGTLKIINGRIVVEK